MPIRFVEVTNKCRQRITVYVRFPRPKKPTKHSETRFDLDPGHTSRVVPYASLVGAKHWDELNRRGCLSLKTVPYTPSFVSIENKQDSPLHLNLLVTKKKRRIARAIRLKPGEISKPLHIGSIVEKRQLKSLAKKKRVAIRPLAYIGPRVGDMPAVGSYGYEDVYVCWECGGPIVFRGNPPVPIHV